MDDDDMRFDYSERKSWRDAHKTSWRDWALLGTLLGTVAAVVYAVIWAVTK